MRPGASPVGVSVPCRVWQRLQSPWGTASPIERRTPARRDAAPPQLEAVDTGQRDHLEATGRARLDARMVGGHVGVVEHEVVVDRPAQAQRPRRHRQRAANAPVAVKHLGQRKHQRPAPCAAGAATRPKPSR